jgi:hypothetical protein
MKDIKKEKKEEKSNWLGRLETAGELASTGLYLRQMARAAEPAMPVMQNYVGPAVGMPVPGGAIARQTFQGLVEEAIPAIGAEGLAAGAGAAVGEVATGGMLLPALGIGAAALAAGSGLYHYAKKYLDDNPDDRRGKIIIDNLENRDKRAKNLIGQAFDDNYDDGSYAQAFGV